MFLYSITAIYLISYIYLEYDCLKRHKRFYFVRVWHRYDHKSIRFYINLVFLILSFPLMALLGLVVGDEL